MRRLISWILSLRARSAPLRFAEDAFRSKYPAAKLRRVEAVAEDADSYFIQVLHDSTSCRMASFWRIAKIGLAARELHASDLNGVFAKLAPLAAEDDHGPSGF